MIYLLESGVILLLLYSIYAAALRKETFFQFNRSFLLAMPLLSLLFCRGTLMSRKAEFIPASTSRNKFNNERP